MARVGQLRLNAIDARFATGLIGWLLGMVRCLRWDLTCGFCKGRFRKVLHFAYSTADCPYCGTRNLLPVPRYPSDPGPLPPNWPEYHPPLD